MENIISKFEGMRVLVIGDVMIDAYLMGQVDRISPEAPVPVVAVKNKESRLGGAANVAMNLVALGAKPILCSVIGEDQEGKELLGLLEKEKIGIEGIICSKERITTVKTRVIAQQHQMLRIDQEISDPISEYDSFLLSKRIINDLLPACDVIIFEDYDKGVITPSLIKQIVAEAHKRSIKIAVDPKKRNFNAYMGVDLFKPNLKELREGLSLGIDKDHPEVLPEVVRLLKTKMPHDNTLITLSEKGVWFQDVNGEITHWPAHERKITDVSGAGDTVISVFALAWILGMKGKNAAALANLAGGLVCEEVGVIPVDTEKLIQEARILGILQ
jgi:rfaE bifunctional protein kinase chain/domain